MIAITAPAYHAETTGQLAQQLAAGSLYSIPDRSESGKLEGEAERLQLEVKAATVRNTVAVDHGRAQANRIKTFEERARDTLRDMLEDMGKGK